MVKVEIKKIICSVETYIAALVIFICLMVTIRDELNYAMLGQYPVPIFYLYFMSIFKGLTDLVMPVVCILPLVISLWNDANSGYGNMVLIRTTKIKYIISKIVSAIFSGIYIMIIGSILFFIILYTMGIGENWDWLTLSGVLSNTIYYEWAEAGKELPCAILMVACYSLTTIPWTMLTLVMGWCVKNKYVLVAIPVLVQQTMLYVCYANIEKLFYINPATWNVSTTDMIEAEMGGLYFTLKVMLIITLICSSAFILLFRRRLKNG